MEQESPTLNSDATELDLASDTLGNQLWRLNNLYYITNRRGKKVKFKMNFVQRWFFSNLWYLNIILKARQMGFTTFIQILFLDIALFESDQRLGVIAHTKPDAQTIFRDKIKFAYENLPEEIRQWRKLKSDTNMELLFNNNSSIRVGTSMRGGTLQYLHVSEFGKICRHYPEKAKEIVTGSLEAVEAGQMVFIESTAEGKSGYFFDYCQTARLLLLSGQTLTSMDYRFHFCGWYENPDNILDAKVSIPKRLIEYFFELEHKHGIELTRQQKNWYVKKEERLGDDIKREHPSTPEEAFEQAIRGAYYSRQFAALYKRKRICEVPLMTGIGVETYWDIGVNDTTAIWFVQTVGLNIHLIDYYENSGEGLDHYKTILDEKGYQYIRHVAPHDIENREWGNKAKKRIDVARELGIYFEVAPNLSVQDGIQASRNLLPHCRFDESACESGVAMMMAYRKQWDAKNGTWLPRPLHDHTSNCADAFRMLAVSHQFNANHGHHVEAVTVNGQPKKSGGWT